MISDDAADSGLGLTSEVWQGRTVVRDAFRNGVGHADGIRRSGRMAAAGFVLSLLVGCPTSGPIGGGSIEDGNRDPALNGSIVGTGGEPNGSFDRAIHALFDSASVARLQGTVSLPGDVDIFSLGALSAGDRIIVDVTTPESLLDATAVLFDGEQRIIDTNDDRSHPGTPGGLDPYFDFIIRHDSDAYYLVVSNSPFAGSNQRTGTYRADVQIIPGEVVPEPVAQILFLEFRGASLPSSPLGPLALAEFRAEDISSIYAGQTAALKELIRATIEQNFERFHVTVLTSDDGPPDSDVRFSTIYFGGFSASLFGIADSVDLYNADFCDDAIIFAESFSPNIFSIAPTVEQLAVAIGNIAAHEAGHLLGLNHTSDDLELMDDQSAADAFLADQEFMLAPLSPDIVGIGFQDSALLLYETVGPRPTP